MCIRDRMYGQGISKEGDILDLASDIDIVQKSGAWYAYNETRIGQGRENAKQFLKEHPEMCLEIENLVREHYGIEPKEFEFEEDENILSTQQTIEE